MVEKKQIVHGLRYNYNGPLNIEEFYAEVEDWAAKKGYHRDLKRKSEYLRKKGKQIEWIVEFWEGHNADSREIVHLQVLFNDFVERKVLRNKQKRTIQYADVYVEINGWVEESLAGRWDQAPLYQFVRTIIDRFVWVIKGTADGHVYGACYDLHKTIKSFFELSKMKV